MFLTVCLLICVNETTWFVIMDLNSLIMSLIIMVYAVLKLSKMRWGVDQVMVSVGVHILTTIGGLEGWEVQPPTPRQFEPWVYVMIKHPSFLIELHSCMHIKHTVTLYTGQF